MGIEVPTVVDALFPGGKPLPAWGTGGDTVAALAVDLPSEAAEGCGVSLVFSILSSVSIGGGSGGVLLFNALWERGGYHPVLDISTNSYAIVQILAYTSICFMSICTRIDIKFYTSICTHIDV